MMLSNPNISTKSAPVTKNDQKVEVVVDGDRAVVRLSTYAEGIGWFVQKTITVDAEMLDSLSEQLAVARGRIRRESDEILSADFLEL